MGELDGHGEGGFGGLSVKALSAPQGSGNSHEEALKSEPIPQAETEWEGIDVSPPRYCPLMQGSPRLTQRFPPSRPCLTSCGCFACWFCF